MSEKRLSIEDIIDEIHDLLDKAWDLPLSRGRSVVDAAKMRDLLEEIRGGLPDEIGQAQKIVADRSDIITSAKREAESIITSAEERAKKLICEERIVHDAKELAQNIVRDAEYKAGEVKQGAVVFADNILKRTEDEFTKGLNDLRQSRAALRNTRRED